MITAFLINLLDFLRLLFTEVPIALYQVIVLRNKEYSIKHIMLSLLRLHPILTVAACFLLIGELNKVQDDYYQKYSDSKVLVYAQKVADDVYVFGDKIFHYAERNETRLQNPSQAVRLYEKYLSNRTYWERRNHRHERNMRLINERGSKAQDV